MSVIVLFINIAGYFFLSVILKITAETFDDNLESVVKVNKQNFISKVEAIKNINCKCNFLKKLNGSKNNLIFF